MLQQLSRASATTSRLYSQIDKAWTSNQPSRLGYPDATSQSTYYIGSPVSPEEVAIVSTALLKKSIDLENSRIRKTQLGIDSRYDVLQASVSNSKSDHPFTSIDSVPIYLEQGDHSEELEKICDSLKEAQKYASGDTQRQYVVNLIKSFECGNMEEYRKSQELWVQNSQPSVETVIGFVEPYRDPYGARAEFEGLVGIVDSGETKLLSALIKNADLYVASLPWVSRSDRDGDKGPFELSEMGFRDFSSIHGWFDIDQSPLGVN